MNYNSYSFWFLFLAVYLLYWRLDHKRQNALLLGASYIFYGAWDYRFLFLILLSTIIDYIGGLGVAGVVLRRRKLHRLALMLCISSLLLCANVRYGALWQAFGHGDLYGMLAALPHRLSDLYIPLATTALTLLYGRVLPWLYAAPIDKRRKYFLTISMVANLLILGFFKYCDFFITSMVDLGHLLGFHAVSWNVLHIILPAGISFYTFQAMSYTIDIYRGECEPTESFSDFALFVCFFPHLVAGPIMRAHTLLPQVVRPRTLREGAMVEGLLLVIIGLFKKIVIADTMAPIANAVFFRFADGTAAGMSGPEALLGLYAFAFQIYGDFSGYSSIARGISKWLGFELVVNFHLPYLAVSPSDFWKRWHISLSSWLRDYLYIPLGGNRKGTTQQYKNLMLTMILGGLWHGASFTFIAWGFYHGAILCLFRLAGASDKVRRDSWGGWAYWLFRVVLMFHLTCIGWLLFRADSFPAAYQMAHLILFDPHVNLAVLAAPLCQMVFYCALLFCIEGALDGELHLSRLWRAPWPVQGAAYVYLLLMILFFHAGQAHEFIYFQF